MVGQFSYLERYLSVVVHLAAMTWIKQNSNKIKTTLSLGTSLCLRYAIVRMFSITTVIPAFAGTSINMTNMANMDMTQSVCESMAEMTCSSPAHENDTQFEYQSD